LNVVLDTVVAIRVGRWASWYDVVDYDRRSACHTVEDNMAVYPRVECVGTGSAGLTSKGHRHAAQRTEARAAARDILGGVKIGEGEGARYAKGRSELDLP